MADGFREQADEALGIVWRLLVMAVVTVALMLVVGIALKPLLPLGLPAGPPGRMILLFVLALCLVAGHLAAVAAFERSQWRLVGLGPTSWRPQPLLLGLLSGMAAVGLLSGLLYVTGGLERRDGTTLAFETYAGDLGIVLLVQTLVEALAFRGYLIGLLEDRFGSMMAVVLTASLAALWHLRAPLATGITVLGVFALASMLAVIRLRTGSLAASWLAHLAVVTVQGLALRSTVGGYLVPTPGYRTVGAGGEWWSGGRWGLDGGIAAVVCFAVVTFLYLRLVPPPDEASDT